MLIAIAVMVFAFGFVLDYADTQHKLAIEVRRAHAAASWSVIMMLLSAASAYAFVKIHVAMIIPEAIGLYFGSVLAVRRARPPGAVKDV